MYYNQKQLVADLFKMWDRNELQEHFYKLVYKLDKTKFDKLSIECIKEVLYPKSQEDES